MPLVAASRAYAERWYRAGEVSRVPPLRKSLGQHHLRHPESAIPAVDFLDVAGCSVVEIGAGGGVLTRLLLENGASRVIACELDLLWTFALRRRVTDPRLVLVAGDGCDLRYQTVPASTRIAGNLPYNVATRIVLAVLARAPVGARAAFLVQREVAQRLAAAPGDSDYGGLSVLVGARATVRRLSVVRPGSFVPPPAVTSAFVGLQRRATPNRRSGVVGVYRLRARRVQPAAQNARQQLPVDRGSAGGRGGAVGALPAVHRAGGEPWLVRVRCAVPGA